MKENDTYRDGTEQSITVTVEDFEECRSVGRQTANELYRQFLETDSDTFELTVRSVEPGSEQ